MKLVSPEALQKMAEAGKTNITELRDELAKIAYTAIVQELGTNVGDLSANKLQHAAVGTAKISFDFAEAFMRERYERECNARVELKPTIPERNNS